MYYLYNELAKHDKIKENTFIHLTKHIYGYLYYEANRKFQCSKDHLTRAAN